MMTGNWFAPCPKNSSKSHYPDCLDMPICPWCRIRNPHRIRIQRIQHLHKLYNRQDHYHSQSSLLLKSTQLNPRKPTCNSGSPAISLRAPATTKAKESTKTDESRPVWAALPFCYYKPCNTDIHQSGARLLAAAGSVSKLKTSPVTARSSVNKSSANNRDGSDKQPFSDAKHASGILRPCVEVLHY